MSHIVPPVPTFPPARAPVHLKPAAPLAERVLLPGDPHRALLIAQDVLDGPRMFNHHRGLWGYTGEAPDGQLLSVQATGMGGPSAAIVVEELVGLGARAFVRVGTCGALGPGLALGDLVTATEVHAADGASAALGAGEVVRPDPALTRALLAKAGGASGAVASSDLFYDDRPEPVRAWREAGVLAVEMEAATIVRVAERHGVRAACLLGVSDLVRPEGGKRIEREALEQLGLTLGRVAAAALAADAAVRA